MPKVTNSPLSGQGDVTLRQQVALGTGTAIGASSIAHYFSKKRVNPLGKHKLGSKKRKLHSPV